MRAPKPFGCQEIAVRHASRPRPANPAPAAAWPAILAALLSAGSAVPILALAAGPAAAAAAGAPCQLTPFQVQFGSDAETRMTVRTGQTCGVSMLMGGRGRTVSGGGPNGMEVGEAPVHGVAKTFGLNAWGYASKPGYTGQDRFVILSSGELMGEHIIRGTSRITVNVDVVP